MPLTTGTTIGHYKIDREIGRGGMGIIFLAHDTRLGRTVALKALPEDVAADLDRLQRFEREARVLASLNHPNIAAIYGLEEADGRRRSPTASNVERSRSPRRWIFASRSRRAWKPRTTRAWCTAISSPRTS